MLRTRVHRSLSNGEAWADAHASCFRAPGCDTGQQRGEGRAVGVVERVNDLVDPLCVRVGVEMVDLEFAGGVLRITVDQPGGVGTEALAALAGEVSRAIDRTDPIPGTFTLEVTSPGIERPLKRPEHFGRVVGARISLKTCPGTEGDRRLEGILEAAEDSGLVVRTDDGSHRAVAYEEVQTGRTVFVWDQLPKSGRQGGRGAAGRNEGSSGP